MNIKGNTKYDCNQSLQNVIDTLRLNAIEYIERKYFNRNLISCLINKLYKKEISVLSLGRHNGMVKEQLLFRKGQKVLFVCDIILHDWKNEFKVYKEL